MKIPKSITPDRIKDSIVEIRYKSPIPFEVSIGMFFNALDNTYLYDLLVTSPSPANGNVYTRKPRFENDFIFINFNQFSVNFRCKNKYLGWEIFGEEVKKAIKQLSTSKVMESYNRVGVRYISEYPDLKLNEIIKFDLSNNFPLGDLETYNFGGEYKSKDFRILIKLNNNVVPVSPQVPYKADAPTLQKTSSIDIDIIKENLETTSLEDIFLLIEEAHNEEKRVFYSLLQDDFLKSLNPTY